MAEAPTGTTTFLLTDIEGSTRRWEEQADEMQVALERHDEVLRTAIETHKGYVFSTAGDSFAAAFDRADDAVAAAVMAQRSLVVESPHDGVSVGVRMGVHTGEAYERDGDYFGPALNRAARVMSAGHGGQILVTESTASLVQEVKLIDLGEHRLRDLSGAIRLFQVQGEGLVSEFASLRTVDAVPGNLPEQATSFVGREIEVEELTELVRANRLVTLTGVGGVGKTRLAVQVAAELIGEFPDGVWLIELAPVGDPAAVPDAVANALSITSHSGLSVTDSIAETLKGSQLLVVLDNCEHVLDAAADLVATILARATTVKVVGTSREGLRVDAEHLWPVPPLDVKAGFNSAAVELFVERAQAVNPTFSWTDEANSTAVTEICQRLDGIALAIELAAARMVSMSPVDVRDRLSDRFRLLSGSRRGLERHQTLRNAVAWSYDLLNDDERALLNRCSVFADGFDLHAATQVCGGGEDLDEYAMLDLLDSLVRKSLVTIEHVEGHARYGLLETIRQFGEDQLAATAAIDQIRDRHAAYFAHRAMAHWDIWNSPRQRVAIDWVDVEFANLRTGFRWAADHGDYSTAAAIAAHTTLTANPLQRYESVGWAEEILDAATTADLVQLPRLYTAAGFCVFAGRPEEAFGYTKTAKTLEADPRCDAFETGWTTWIEGVAYLYTDPFDRWLEISAILAEQSGFARVAGLSGMLFALPIVGRAEEAMAIAEETLTAARELGNPYWIAHALDSYGRAFTEADPVRALMALREGLDYTQEHRDPFWEAILSRDAAGLEAEHGEFDKALELFETSIDLFHRAGDRGSVGSVLAYLAVFFERIEQPEIAGTIYGTSSHYGTSSWVPNLPDFLDHLRVALGETQFEEAVTTGTAMDLSDAVQYARYQIRNARLQAPHIS